MACFTLIFVVLACQMASNSSFRQDVTNVCTVPYEKDGGRPRICELSSLPTGAAHRPRRPEDGNKRHPSPPTMLSSHNKSKVIRQVRGTGLRSSQTYEGLRALLQALALLAPVTNNDTGQQTRDPTSRAYQTDIDNNHYHSIVVISPPVYYKGSSREPASQFIQDLGASSENAHARRRIEDKHRERLQAQSFAGARV